MLIFPQKCRLTCMTLIIQMIAAGSAISISEKTKTDILSQFDTTENAIQSFWHMFADGDGLESAAEIAPSLDNHSNDAAANLPNRCALPLDKFSNFEDEVNKILSKLTQNPKTCKVSWIYVLLMGKDYKNCKDLAKLIQCGVGQVKNGFSETVNDDNDNEAVFEWKNVYQNLTGLIHTALNDTVKSYHYEEKIGIVNNEIRNLQNALNRMDEPPEEDENEEEDTKNCVQTKLSQFCPVNSWNYFQNDVKGFLEVCDFGSELMSYIHNGDLQAAGESFQKLKEAHWKHYEIFQEVIAILYEYEGKDKLENILTFITSVEWYAHRIYFIARLVDEMKNHNDFSCSRLAKVLTSINSIAHAYKYNAINDVQQARKEAMTIWNIKKLETKRYQELCNFE